MPSKVTRPYVPDRSVRAGIRPHVFVSYNGRDERATEHIVHRLRTAGVTAWISSQELKPGQDWTAAIESARKRHSIWLIFAGPNGIGSQQEVEVEEAARRLSNEPDRFRVIPVLLPGIELEQVKRLPEIFHKLYRAEFRSLDEEAGMEQLLRGLRDSAVRRLQTGASGDLRELASSRRRMALMAARLLLRTREGINLAKSPDIAALHEVLRNSNVTGFSSVLKLEAELVNESDFKPNPLWLAWIENVHGPNLDLMGKELLALPENAAPAAGKKLDPPPVAKASRKTVRRVRVTRKK